MGDSIQTADPRPISVLVVGANGYLGLAICRAFLRAAAPGAHEDRGRDAGPCPYRVYGLVRRPSAAHDLAANEVTPIVSDLADVAGTLRKVLSHSVWWDVIVTCTEPAKTDPAVETQHWNAVLELVVGLGEASSRLVVPGSPGRRRPFVLWSSGCKDYGTTGLHGDPDLQPHTETSPLDAPPPIRGRTDAALRALGSTRATGNSNGVPVFDVAVVRATPVYGYSGSHFGAAFEYASRAAAARDQHENAQDTVDFAADAGTISHSLHVGDCAEAYVALAATVLSDEVDSDGRHVGLHAIAGKFFNVLGRRYETLKEVGAALAAEYGFTGGARFGLSPGEIPADDMTGLLVFGWSQWADSDKIRHVTGWADRRPLFSENVGVYRLAYEVAKTQGSDNVGSISRRMAGDWGERK
ncbi:NAD dependent epimerase [Colletotrichum musicola]|uniref:NAD dependent epimerase n=1 Tax=Colletotrichum musicola TaxID=2175873 RepID=A0A8H6KTL1_9PEZI|nr:NAD dependent epimerase [Colletotrichum musicola]